MIPASSPFRVGPLTAAGYLVPAGAAVGGVFCSLTLASDPVWTKVWTKLWAKSTRGHGWTWDPRLGATLLLWLIYMAYLLLPRRLAAVVGN